MGSKCRLNDRPELPARRRRRERLEPIRQSENVILFDFFSLDFIYYPVSWIMWVWYRLFALLDHQLASLGVVGDVPGLHTACAAVQKPFVRQIRTTRQMRNCAATDQGLAAEIRQGSPAGWRSKYKAATRARPSTPFSDVCRCWRRFRVFLGLYHVLRLFNRTTGSFGQPRVGDRTD